MFVLISALICLVQDAAAMRVKSSRDMPKTPLVDQLAPGEEWMSSVDVHAGKGCDAKYAPDPAAAFYLETKTGTEESIRDAIGAIEQTFTRMKPAKTWLKKKPDGTTGWNGFCQMGWSLCPDSVAMKDYNLYGKTLGGPAWVADAGSMDKDYCRNAGFLKPEIAILIHNFTALHDKADELCRTKFSDPKYNQDGVTLMGGVIDAFAIGMPKKIGTAVGMYIDELQHFKIPDKDKIWESLPTFDEEAAGHAAAWNCALGDMGCDIAYCNYAYCELPDGRVGIKDECPGFDVTYGQPRTWPGGKFPKSAP